MKKPQKKQSKKGTKKATSSTKSVRVKQRKKGVSPPAREHSAVLRLPSQSIPAPQQVPRQEHRGSSIAIHSIDGETTIGDLIVVFPRTRDVLLKHGLRFDVEDAGYLYMTLSVFSAMHGHSTSSLVEQLVVASKEPPAQPTPQPLRTIPASASA